MANEPIDPVAQRAFQVEAEGKSAFGEENWKKAIEGVGRQMEAGQLTPNQLQEKLARPGAAGTIFYDGIANASEADWRAWRDAQPNRRRRIEKAAR